MIRLTADQINHLDELENEEESVNQVLEVALNRAENRLGEIRRERAQWWDQIADAYGLDLEGKTYLLKREGGFYSVVEQESDEP